MTASSLIYKSNKKWSYWRVESAPTRDYVVSRGWPHMNRVIQTRASVPGNEKVRGQQAHAQCCFELEWR